MISFAAAALVSVLLLGARPAAPENVADDLRYWYYDIHDPFFRREKSPAGETLWVNARPQSRPLRFAEPKALETFRVFILGGSVAHLFEISGGTRGPTLAQALERRLPGRRVEALYCGMPGYDSWREGLIFDEVLAHEPDLLILMSGNNDFMPNAGPPSQWLTLAYKTRRALGLPPPRLTKSPGAGTPPAPEAQRETFAGNLRRMARAARERGIPLVLCSLPRRLGHPPNAPLPLWEKPVFEGWSAWQAGDLAQARQRLGSFLAENPDSPTIRHALGRVLEAAGDATGARAEYRAALYPEPNPILRRVAAEEKVLWADLEAAFEAAADGASLESFLPDPVHWYRSGDTLVAAVIAAAFQGAPLETAPPLRPDPAELRDTFWKRLATAFLQSAASQTSGEGKGRLSEEPIAQFDGLWREDPGLMAALEMKRAQVAAAYRESRFHMGVSQDFESMWPAGLAHAAETCARRGEYSLAIRLFDRALEARPGFTGAALLRSVALARAGRRTEAAAGFRALAPLEKDFPEITLYRQALGL
ncbi:MAG: hypothetical protein A2X36_09335 [Elusimicrobia bacterium GWA2_69_24]|nr:MAG: hypothetical protein A2X36_09335 [Elusimicrobia bacterium GWA2_69_24]HBL15968.1 hypothetical protein [Elusimicrobiota bacterium]